MSFLEKRARSSLDISSVEPPRHPTSVTFSFAMKHRPEIDGLRAVAVIPVVMFHLGVGCSGGFVGVDVFFVISGFLITRIIWRGIEAKEFSIAEFWERRIRRILPALAVMVLATLCVGYRILMPEELADLGRASVAQTLLCANVYFWQNTGYFAGPAEYKPLLHTWSLAVEEQFYLVFPLILCFFRRVSRHKLLAILSATAFVSFSASVYGARFYPDATFFLLPTRSWELLVGCILALIPIRLNPSVTRDSLIATLGLLGIMLPVFFYDQNTQFPGLTAVPPVLGTAAIIFATAHTPRVWLSQVLSLRPLVFIGLLSYSLYLWHWPVIVFTRIHCGEFEWQQQVFAAVVSVCASIASWKFVETPFRRKEFLKSRPRLFSVALTVSVALLVASLTLSWSQGLLFLYPNYSPVLATDAEYRGREYSVSTASFDSSAIPVLGVGRDGHHEQKQLDFLVWGDSHAMMLCSTIDRIAHAHNLSGRVVCSGGQVPLPKIRYHHNNPEYTEGLIKWIRANKPRNIILVNRWSGRTNGRNETEAEYESGPERFLSDDRILSTSRKQSIEVFGKALRNFADFCHNEGINLWIVKQVPEINLRHPAGDMLKYSLGRKSAPPPPKIQVKEAHIARQKIANQIIDNIETPSVRILDPTPYLIDLNGFVAVHSDGRSFYYDEDHLTEAGAALLQPMFSGMFSEIQFKYATKN